MRSRVGTRKWKRGTTSQQIMENPYALGVLTFVETSCHNGIVAVASDKIEGRLHMRSALPNAK